MLPPFMVTVPHVVNPAAVVLQCSSYAASVQGHGAVVVVNPAAVDVCGVPGYAASVHGHGAVVVVNPAAVVLRCSRLCCLRSWSRCRRSWQSRRRRLRCSRLCCLRSWSRCRRRCKSRRRDFCGVPVYAAFVHGHGAGAVVNPAAVPVAVFSVMLPLFMVTVPSLVAIPPP